MVYVRTDGDVGLGDGGVVLAVAEDEGEGGLGGAAAVGPQARALMPGGQRVGDSGRGVLALSPEHFINKF